MHGEIGYTGSGGRNMKHYPGKCIRALLCLALLSTACPSSNTAQEYTHTTDFSYHKEPASRTLSMITAGDALIHKSVYMDAYISGNRYDFTHMLTSIKKFIAEYDVKFYNQESIIGGKGLGVSTYPRFNTPDDFADAMVDAGFTMVSLANNHTLDRGERAVMYSTKEYWPAQPVMTAGSYDSFDGRNAIRMKEKNGIRYTLLSYTVLTNGLHAEAGKEYLVNVYNKERVKEDIEKVKPHVDAVLVSMHWGEEYAHTPSASQKEIAAYLSSLGANVIIGHHPHVVQPIEFIGDTLVMYSLGNFLSGQVGIEKNIGAMASFDIVKDTPGKVTISNVKAHLLYTYYNKNFKNFHVYPFTELNSSILPNYLVLYNTYSQIVKRYDRKNSIAVAPLQ